jgi:hypothetical protein
MKLKQHIDINWERWLRPRLGHTISHEPLDHAVLKAVTYAPRGAGQPDQVALELEQGGKSLLVAHVFSDGRFARRLRQDLQAHCLNMRLCEIGERPAP